MENLKLALTQSSHSKAIDSIELQIGYYEKQLKLLCLRKALCQKTDKHRTNEDNECILRNLTINEHVEITTELQLDLIKNLEDSYNLIEELSSIDNPQVSSRISQLQSLNSELNLIFHKLSVSIEEVVRENESLREKTKHVDDSKSATTCNISDKDEYKKDSENSDDSSHEIQELPPLELPKFNLDDECT